LIRLVAELDSTLVIAETWSYPGYCRIRLYSRYCRVWYCNHVTAESDSSL